VETSSETLRTSHGPNPHYRWCAGSHHRGHSPLAVHRIRVVIKAIIRHDNPQRDRVEGCFFAKYVTNTVFLSKAARPPEKLTDIVTQTLGKTTFDFVRFLIALLIADIHATRYIHHSGLN
jgi:hypothetical protein